MCQRNSALNFVVYAQDPLKLFFQFASRPAHRTKLLILTLLQDTMATNGTSSPHGTNGTNGLHTVTNSSSMNPKHPHSDPAGNGSAAPLATAGRPEQPKANREGIVAAFSQFAQLIHSPRNPLPTQNGRGTASVKRTQTGLRLDLRYIGWKGTGIHF